MLRPLLPAFVALLMSFPAASLEPRDYAEALARRHQEGDHLGALEQLRNDLPNKELPNEPMLLATLRSYGTLRKVQLLDEQNLQDRVRDVLLLLRFDRVNLIATFGFVKLGDGWHVTNANYNRQLEALGNDLRAYGGRTATEPLPILDEAMAAHKAGKHQDAIDRLRPAGSRPELPVGVPDPAAMQDARSLTMLERLGPITETVLLDDVELAGLARRALVLYASATQSLLAQYSFTKRGNDWRLVAMVYGYDPTAQPLKQLAERK